MDNIKFQICKQIGCIDAAQGALWSKCKHLIGLENIEQLNTRYGYEEEKRIK